MLSAVAGLLLLQAYLNLPIGYKFINMIAVWEMVRLLLKYIIYTQIGPLQFPILV